jgi:perosamine synthetase
MPDLIPISQPFLSSKEEAYALDALRSGWISSIGPYIIEFEKAFAAYCGTEHALAASNGTTALHLALAALGIASGDEVIVPDLSFIASANAVAYTGATPVLVDIDPDTLCLSPRAVERAITPRTRAIMPVHLYGHPADMDAINAIAATRNLLVIEDAAESHGAKYKGKPTGGLGHCGAFSFYGNKIMTTGEGGMITTNDHDLYQKAKILRDHGMDPTRRYWYNERGFNYRMTNIQAAIGLAQLEQIDAFVAKRHEIAGWYRQLIHTSADVRLNHVADWASCCYWMVCLEVDAFDRPKRDRFIAALREKNVDSRPYFYPMSVMPMYADSTRLNAVSARKSQIGVNLPTYYALTRGQAERVADTVNRTLTDILSTKS